MSQFCTSFAISILPASKPSWPRVAAVVSRFGDDPQLHAVAGLVHTQEAAPIDQRLIVEAFIHFDTDRAA
jgi:hypothetical protein